MAEMVRVFGEPRAKKDKTAIIFALPHWEGRKQSARERQLRATYARGSVALEVTGDKSALIELEFFHENPVGQLGKAVPHPF